VKIRLLVLALLCALLGASAFTLTRSVDEYPLLNPQLVAEITYLSKEYNALPVHHYVVTAANAPAFTLEWQIESAPFFRDTGIISSYTMANVVYTFSDDPNEAFHLLGQTDCGGEVAGFAVQNPSPTIWLNGRVFNPVSPWYQSDFWLPTIIHEIAHDQGVCVGDSPYVESSTQVVTLEVMAAMVNSGNLEALHGLLYEWRSIVEGALMSEAVKSPKALAQFQRFVASVDGSPEAIAFSKGQVAGRFWTKTGIEELKGILTRYELAPYEMVKNGLRVGYLAANETATVDSEGRQAYATILSPNGQALPLDDLRYLFNHLDALVAAAQLQPRR